jgi:hypothetical protein
LRISNPPQPFTNRNLGQANITLTFLIINVHALQRAKAINAALLSTSNGALQMN